MALPECLYPALPLAGGWQGQVWHRGMGFREQLVWDHWSVTFPEVRHEGGTFLLAPRCPRFAHPTGWLLLWPECLSSDKRSTSDQRSRAVVWSITWSCHPSSATYQLGALVKLLNSPVSSSENVQNITSSLIGLL